MQKAIPSTSKFPDQLTVKRRSHIDIQHLCKSRFSPTKSFYLPPCFYVSETKVKLETLEAILKFSGGIFTGLFLYLP